MTRVLNIELEKYVRNVLKVREVTNAKNLPRIITQKEFVM